MVLWCYVTHINPAKICPKTITKNDKKLANNLNYDGIEFSVEKKDFCKIEKRNNICFNAYYYENKLTFPIYVSNENSMDLFILLDKNKSHYVYIKDLTGLCFTKQKIKTKNTFVRVVYSVLVVKIC